MIPGLPLEVNDLLQVRIKDPGSPYLCESRVEELAADELLISWPAENGMLLPIREHQVLTVSFGRDQKIFEFEALVLSKVDDPVALLAIRPSGPLRSMQRRNYVRVRALVPIELTPKVVRLATYKGPRNADPHIRTETCTISAGGFSIRHNVPVPVGTVYQVRIALPGEQGPPLSATARVMRCNALSETGYQSAPFELGFFFTRISETARTRLVRFVFRVQREARAEA